MIKQEKNNFNRGNFTYTRSFAIAFGVIVLGFILQFFKGGIDIALVKSPVNILILILLVLFITIGHIRYKQSTIVQWFSSTKAAIASIVGFSVVSLLMGFISQEDTTNSMISALGLNTIAFGWPYVFSLLLLVSALGFATAKRIFPFRKQNFWYILNHLGLWITLVSANFGFADQTHLRMNISNAGYSNLASDESGMIYQLPFEIKQMDFKLENYSPKLTIMDNKTSMYSLKSGKNTIEAKQNASLTIENWSIQILKIYDSARKIKNRILSFDSVGAAPAALVRAENTVTKEIKQGWVSCGNSLIDASAIALDNSHSLVMLSPTSKEISLGIGIKKNDKISTSTIAINSPQSFEGWKIYIFGFNEQKGKWSTSTSIELIKDRWQPFVYLGLAMMIVGSFFVFWRGKK